MPLLLIETGDAQALFASKNLGKHISLVRKVMTRTASAPMQQQFEYMYCGKYEASSGPMM